MNKVGVYGVGTACHLEMTESVREDVICGTMLFYTRDLSLLDENPRNHPSQTWRDHCSSVCCESKKCACITPTVFTPGRPLATRGGPCLTGATVASSGVDSWVG
jgi:hypothetical protein